MDYPVPLLRFQIGSSMQQILLTEVDSRTQGSRPTPRTQKNFEAKDRRSRGQGPRTQAQVFSKKKNVHKNFFQAISKKKILKNFFQAKKVFEKFFSVDLRLRKRKKVFGNFSRGFWRFPTKFLRFKN